MAGRPGFTRRHSKSAENLAGAALARSLGTAAAPPSPGSPRHCKSTFHYQDALPKLPIPELGETCDKFLATVQPLLSAEQYAQTQAAVEQFRAAEGEAGCGAGAGAGARLQTALRAWAATQDSYIEAFWDDSYLTHAESVVLNLNPFFVLERDPTPERGSQTKQVSRATTLVLSSLKFVAALRKGVLEPDVWRGTPLCMSQFKRMFGASRRAAGHHGAARSDRVAASPWLGAGLAQTQFRHLISVRATLVIAV